MLPPALKALCKRRSESILVCHRDVRFSDGEVPDRHVCHTNVDRWVKENPECKAVRGWLDTGGLLDHHSVVTEADGTLFDVTPLRTPGLGFIPHLGDEETFRALRAYGQITCVE
jgi:hypothetical protein